MVSRSKRKEAAWVPRTRSSCWPRQQQLRYTYIWRLSPYLRSGKCGRFDVRKRRLVSAYCYCPRLTVHYLLFCTKPCTTEGSGHEWSNVKLSVRKTWPLTSLTLWQTYSHAVDRMTPIGYRYGAWCDEEIMCYTVDTVYTGMSLAIFFLRSWLLFYRHLITYDFFLFVVNDDENGTNN